MDLRRSVLLKRQQNVLGEVSFNTSNLSVYESAAEESDNSIYFSFIEDSSKSTNYDDFSNDEHDQSINSEIDKENTVIMRQQTPNKDVPVDESRDSTPMKNKGSDPKSSGEEVVDLTEESPIRNKEVDRNILVDLNATKVIDNPLLAIVNDTELKIPQVIVTGETSSSPQKQNAEENIEKSDDIILVENEEQKSGDIIVIEDEIANERFIEGNLNPSDAMITERKDSPLIRVVISEENFNENIVNPFTTIVQAISEPATKAKKDSVIEKPLKRRSVLKVPAKTTMIRRSLDRKVKAPTAARRTIYGAPRAVQSESNLRTSKRSESNLKTSKSNLNSKSVQTESKTPSKLPKPMARPKSQKCTFAGCTSEFATIKALQEHQKTHKPSTSQSFSCKWCDKKFQLENALTNHQTEKCTQIPFNEKRKILAKNEKKESERRRTTIFTVPVPRMKSPRRRPSVTPDKLNKSGIKITPKRSLKCHICQAVVPDAITLANHVLAHKYNKDNVAN